MRKRCYSLTFLGVNAAGGNDYRINCMIYLQGTGGVNAAEIRGYAMFLEAEIRSVWSTAGNPGLSAGMGPYRYNKTLDTFTCNPPIPGTAAHNRDTGVVVQINNIGLKKKKIFKRYRQNQILFVVDRTQPPNKRPFLDEGAQYGELFYHLPNRPDPSPLSPASVLNYDPINLDVNFPDVYLQVHNTISHEFGHALGLSDRYHYLAFGNYEVNSNGNNTVDKSNQWISRHAGGDCPMYLPGIYDKRRSDYNTNDLNANGYAEQAPNLAYSLPVYYNPDNTPVSNPPPPFPDPQPDYNPNLILTEQQINDWYHGEEPLPHRGPYDIEYSTLFGWEHNIMSKKMGINDIGGQSGSRFFGQYSTGNPADTGVPGIPADPLYAVIYGPEMLPGNPEVVLITSVQTDVITDRGINGDPPTIVGAEVISKRTEKQIAIDRGYPEGLFDQYVFILQRDDEQRNYIMGPNQDPLLLNALDQRGPTPEQRGLRVPNTSRLKEYFITRSGGSFVGIHYKTDLDMFGMDEENNKAIIVSDWKFDIDDNQLQVLGITDCMDFRMSRIVTKTVGNENHFRWELEPWDYPAPVPDSKDVSRGFLGFINPGVKARRGEIAPTRREITGQTNLVNRIANLELDNLNDNFFRGYPKNFVQEYPGGLPDLSVDYLYFGTTDATRFVQRVYEQYNNAYSRQIFDGKFQKGSPYYLNGLIFSAAVSDEDDLYHKCGIASDVARNLWNSIRNDTNTVNDPNNPPNGKYKPYPKLVLPRAPLMATPLPDPYQFTIASPSAGLALLQVHHWTAIPVGNQIKYTLHYDYPNGWTGYRFPSDLDFDETYSFQTYYFHCRYIIELITLGT